jgi:hypothetical protein
MMDMRRYSSWCAFCWSSPPVHAYWTVAAGQNGIASLTAGILARPRLHYAHTDVDRPSIAASSEVIPMEVAQNVEDPTFDGQAFNGGHVKLEEATLPPNVL